MKGETTSLAEGNPDLTGAQPDVNILCCFSFFIITIFKVFFFFFYSEGGEGQR